MSMVMAKSITHNDIVRIDGETFRVVGRIYQTNLSIGLSLYPCAVEPGRTIADMYWFAKRERIERIKR